MTGKAKSPAKASDDKTPAQPAPGAAVTGLPGDGAPAPAAGFTPE